MGRKQAFTLATRFNSSVVDSVFDYVVLGRPIKAVGFNSSVVDSRGVCHSCRFNRLVSLLQFFCSRFKGDWYSYYSDSDIDAQASILL